MWLGVWGCAVLSFFEQIYFYGFFQEYFMGFSRNFAPNNVLFRNTLK